ncbi:serine protease [Pseudomonas avellanae]|nr:serine protease [Pseudomonas avellanae]EGH08361.1 trypsin domain-containing protein [Pseudomonas amygdali pv. morsprunorum str. M302280]POP85897.1 serine protease [Pseudomonas amygdali pv. morsprunorum]SOS36750.1 trypsin [Pseudomonas syringae group genomosp. 3]AVB22640.1 serine protease [Pseudomonas avellanae]SPF20916.1 trypsin [Pseudomonas syringae group genomosp. 3]
MTEAKTLLSRMMMKLPTITGACCIAALLPFSTHAATNDLGEGILSLAPSRVLLNADGSRDHWNGIGRIKSRGGSSCTATLIDTRSADSPPDAPAYVVTSGHCISRQNGVIITDREVEGSIQFNFFTDSTARSYPLKRINWSSMQGVDLAVVELQPTLKSLIDDGIQPLALASEMPEQDREILWVGAPLTRDTGHLRMAACVHKTSEVIMEQPWVWRHTVSNQCRDVDVGASGSPLLIRDNSEIYAVLNLTNQPESEGATEDFNNEIPGFPLMAPDSNYGSPFTALNRCFVSGTFSTDPAVCELFPTFSVNFDTLGRQPGQRARVQLDAEGNDVYPAWDLLFQVDTPFYRYKKVTSAMQCEDQVDYSQAYASQAAAINEPVDGHIGINWLCIIGVSSADEQPSIGLMRNALTLAIELQAAGPTPEPQVKIGKNRFGASSVSWSYEHRLIDHYTVKMGPPDTTECSDPQGFKTQFRDLTLRAKWLPLKICTYAHDINGQPSALREDIVPAAD